MGGEDTQEAMETRFIIRAESWEQPEVLVIKTGVRGNVIKKKRLSGKDGRRCFIPISYAFQRAHCGLQARRGRTRSMT